MLFYHSKHLGLLTWIISPLMRTQVDFLNIMFTLKDGYYMNYTLYTKELNLHLYLLPH
jgi:hypothetical protein